MHCFEIRTANVDYFIGEDPLYGHKDPSKITLPSPETGIGGHLAKTWENALKLHCMAEIMKGNILKACLLFESLSHQFSKLEEMMLTFYSSSLSHLIKYNVLSRCWTCSYYIYLTSHTCGMCVNNSRTCGSYIM